MARRINHAETPLPFTGLPGTDLAQWSPKRILRLESHRLERHRQRDFRDEPSSVVNPNLRARPGALHVAERERGPSRQIVLETLFGGPDCDLPLFAHLASEHRVIIPASGYLPDWLQPLPQVIQRKRRRFWWSLRAKPVSGWHVQQFLNRRDHHCPTSAVASWIRTSCSSGTSMARFEYQASLLNMVSRDGGSAAPFALSEPTIQHLGLPTPAFPASDFIGQILFWDQQPAR
jgi:hypothetical protein